MVLNSKFSRQVLRVGLFRCTVLRNIYIYTWVACKVFYFFFPLCTAQILPFQCTLNTLFILSLPIDLWDPFAAFNVITRFVLRLKVFFDKMCCCSRFISFSISKKRKIDNWHHKKKSSCSAAKHKMSKRSFSIPSYDWRARSTSTTLLSRGTNHGAGSHRLRNPKKTHFCAFSVRPRRCVATRRIRQSRNSGSFSSFIFSREVQAVGGVEVCIKPRTDSVSLFPHVFRSEDHRECILLAMSGKYCVSYHLSKAE